MNMNIIISGESICAECGAGMETGYENIFLCTKETSYEKSTID